MNTISIPDRRVGTTTIGQIHNVTRQTASRWCAAGRFETAKLETLVGLRGWTAELREVLLFTRPATGCRSRLVCYDEVPPSLSEEQVRAYLDGLEE